MKPKINNPFLARFQQGRTLAGLGSLLLTGGVATAATVYWDTNGATAGSGNTGNSWGGANWTSDAAGTSATAAWVDGDSAVFSAGTDGNGTWTVTLATTVSTPSITFAQTGTKTIAAGGTINIGGGTIASTALGFAPGNGDDININSVLAGAGGLTIAAHGDATSNNGGGGGAEFRLGANNTFTGGLTVTSGLVSWNTDANLGDISNVITLNGGGLLATGASHTTVRSIEIGSAGGTFRNYGSTTVNLNGPVSNVTGVASTTVRRTDGGTLRLNGSGAGFVGTWINGAGSTQLSAANANWASTDFQVLGGNLNPNGTGTAVVNSITSSADVVIDNGTTLDVDSGSITMVGAHVYRNGVLPIGKLTSSSGTLSITNGAATGDLTTVNHQIQVPIVNAGATPVALVKNNRNSLVLTQANTFSGGTTINGGRVEATNTGTFGTGAVTVAIDGQAFLTGSVPHANSFTINGNGTAEGVNSYGALRFANTSTVAGGVNVASASRITALGANETGTLAGPLTGSSNLEKTGAGRLSITGDASGYTGLLTATAGTLSIGNSFGGSVAVPDGASVAGEGTIAGSLTLGTTVGSGMLANGSTAAALTATDLTVNGLTQVRLLGLPVIPGSPVDILKYTGTLTMAGTANDAFQLVDELSYRGLPSFADTGSAITLTIPAGASLVWAGTDVTNPTFWNNNVTPNWLNGGSPDVFFAGDNVLFDDSAATKTVAMQGLLSPASVTFNNSTGNDYSITPNGVGFGFTGATSIVKNGTGTATIQGFSHNYTGTVTINAGVLQGSGNNELLGNASAVTVNNGGQLNFNGQNYGAGTRHYSMTIAGTGANGLGALTNSGAGSPNENAGILNLTLSDNASVGGNGGRYDIGRSGGSFGTIAGNGFTLTKVGSGSVCMRAPATDLTYIVSAGTLKFEDSDLATGPNAIAVNGGTLQAYGNRAFANNLNFAAGTTLDNDGGGNQIWNGAVTLTGTVADTVNLNARNGAITLTGAISGASNVRLNSNNIVYLAGSASNTYSGNTTLASLGQLVLAKTGGAVAVPGDMFMSATGTRALLSATQDNQFGPNSVLRYTGTGDNRFELKGTTQTVAGLDSTGATPGYINIQHSEFATPPAVDAVSDLIVNVSGTNSFTYGGVLRDQGGKVNLTKSGTGTQNFLGGLIDYTGPTLVTGGKMFIDSDDTHTVSLNIAAGAVYEAGITSLTNTFEHTPAGFTLSGAGTYVKSGPGNATLSWNGGSSVAMASGALIEITNGQIRLEYGGTATWTSNLSDLTITGAGSLNLWDNNNAGVFVDALNGNGQIVRTLNQTGNLTVGVDNGSGNFSGAISNASGKTNLIKAGTGTQTLSGLNSYTGNTTVNDGALILAETGSLAFVVTDAASNQINGSGSVTLDGDFTINTAAVTVSTGTWNLVDTNSLVAGFTATFSPGAGWTETANVWSKTENNKIWSFSEASGDLSVKPTYASWIAGFFPGETNPDIIGDGADPDKDGIANSVELIVGGNPATGMDTALLPTIELVTDPAGVPAGDYLLFTYRRSDLSVLAGVTAVAEFDADLLAPWTTAVDGVDGVEILVDDNYGSFVPPAADTDRVRVFVPRGANPLLFGRLGAIVP